MKVSTEKLTGNKQKEKVSENKKMSQWTWIQKYNQLSEILQREINVGNV